MKRDLCLALCVSGEPLPPAAVLSCADSEALRAHLAAKGFDVTKLEVTGKVE